MTTVKQLIESFDSLPESEKHQATVAILRRSGALEIGDIPESALTKSADELFQVMDEEEIADASR